MRRERGLLWVVLAGFVAGLVVVAAVAVGGGDDEPDRLPALAIGSDSRAAGASLEGGAADMMFPAQRVEYRLGGSLPDLPDEAPVYELAGSVDEAAVRRVADAVGLDGATVERQGDAWVARTDDRELRVEGGVPGAPWYLSEGRTSCGPDVPVSSDGGSVAVACLEAVTGHAVTAETEARAGEGGSVEPTEPAPPATVEPCPMPDCPPGTACAQVCPAPPMPVPPPERPADLPTKDEAERIAREVLEASGTDLTGARVKVEDGFDQWFVNVEPAVDGVPTVGLTHGVSVGPKGAIRFANGWLGDPEKGADYPLATLERAVERLQEAGGFGWTAYADDRVMAATGMPYEGGGEEQEPIVHTISDARLGLMFAPLAEGNGGMLVPAYLLTVEEQPEFELPAIAVADEYLPTPRPVDEQRPVPEPAPVPGGSSGSGVSTGSGSAGGGCAGSGSPDGIEVQLCGPGELAVGEEGTFTLTVVHPRGAFIDSGCAEPTVSFGDEGDTAICDIGCSAPADGAANKFGKTFTHAYDEPGTYAAAAFVRLCEEGSGDLRVELPVVVR